MKLLLVNNLIDANQQSELLVIPQFMNNYDYIFYDENDKFVGCSELKVMLLSSLTLELINSKKSIMGECISSKIYFIH